MEEILEHIGLKNTVSIAVRIDKCFQLLPTTDGKKHREYYRPHDVEEDYRKLVKKYGPENVKIFREIQVVLQSKKVNHNDTNTKRSHRID